jgi:hypothetical protein
MSLSSRFDALARNAAAQLDAVHLRSQGARFVRLALVSFAAQLATLGTGEIGWKVLAAFAVGAAETAFRQVWPASPLPAVIKAIQATAPAPSTATSSPAQPPASAAEPNKAP